MRKSVRVVFALLCCGVFLVTGLAMAERDGDFKEGKALFKEMCKNCHVKDAEGGEVTPLIKTMSQWERYFKKGEHKNGQEKLEEIVTAEQLIDIKAFLVHHAADSDQPETCG